MIGTRYANDDHGRMIFNGHDFGDVLTVNPTRTLAPASTDTTVTVPGRAGAVFMRADLQPRTVTVEARLKLPRLHHELVADMRHEIASHLVTSKPAKLYLPDDPDRYLWAVFLESGALENLWNTGSAELTFRAYDPFFYGRRRRQELQAGSNRLDVEGTWRAVPKFHLTALSSGRVAALNEDTGDYVRISATAAAGATVVLDMDESAPAARLNTNLVAVELGSDYFQMEPGERHIRLENATGYVEWDERWL